MNHLKSKKSKYIKIKKTKNITKSTKLKKEFQFDIGLGILRPILAFLVIMTHAYNPYYARGNWRLIYVNTKKLHFHILDFIIIAFYFSYNTLVSNDYIKKLKRFIRIYIPYFAWPTIIVLSNKHLTKICKIKRTLTFKDLKNQLISGSGFIYSFYFQWSLSVLTILHIIIILLFRKHCIFILMIISIIAFHCEYNGITLVYFKKSKYPFGRTIEFIPCSALGFIFSSLGIINYLKKYRLKTLIICIYSCYIIIYYNIFIETKGFGVNGIKLFLFATCIFIIFALFPSEKIKNKIIIKIIKQITNHTAGVYYLHLSVFYYARFYIKPIGAMTIKGCLINYLICYFICLIGNLIFGKTILRHLFI